jgi:protein-S-isoprenylcysteine O-methyltransferase Ste14
MYDHPYMARRSSWRQLVTYAASLGVLAAARPQWPTFAAGAGMAAIGIALRIWGCGHLRKNMDLITSGPYAHVQHPLYLGTFLIALGAIVAAGSPTMPGLLIWVVAGPLFMIAFLGYYLPKKFRVEGQRLGEKFAGFQEYAHSVPKFVPSLRRYPAASRERWSASTFWRNHELGMDILVIAVFALMVYVPRWFAWV